MTIESPPTQEPVDREALAAYLAALSSDLAQIARDNGLDTLGYILEMARLEAEQTLRGSRADTES